MGFQKKVGLQNAIGTPGLEVVPGQAVYTAFNYISDGTVQAGTFAFEGEPAKGTGEAFGIATFKKSSGKLLGFVERNLTGVLALNEEGSEIYPEGIGLTIAKRGQFYALATGSATAGQSVLCDPATGAVTYGAAGAANDTGFIVVLPQGVKTVAKDDIVIYENLGLGVKTAQVSSVGDAKVDEAKVSG